MAVSADVGMVGVVILCCLCVCGCIVGEKEVPADAVVLPSTYEDDSNNR